MSFFLNDAHNLPTTIKSKSFYFLIAAYYFIKYMCELCVDILFKKKIHIIPHSCTKQKIKTSLDNKTL